MRDVATPGGSDERASRSHPSPGPGFLGWIALAAGVLAAALAAPTSASGAAWGEGNPEWIARADSLLERGEAAAAIAWLDGVIDSAPDDPAARWRAARAAYQMGILASEAPAQNAWFRLGVDHAIRALEAAPDDPDALRWAVAVTGSLADGKGIGPRETAQLAERTWALIDRLLAVAPDDPIAHGAAGFLHAKIMKLSRAERFLARVFLGGGALGSASWEEALREQRRAVALAPDDILHRVRLATSLDWHGERDAARAEMDAALRLPVRTPVDLAYREQGLRWRAEHGAE